MARSRDVLLLEVAFKVAALLSLAEAGNPAALELAEVGLAVLVQQLESLVGAWPRHFVDPLVGEVLHPARQDHPLPAQRLLRVIGARSRSLRSACVEHRNSPHQLHRTKTTSLPSPMAMAFFLLT